MIDMSTSPGRVLNVYEMPFVRLELAVLTVKDNALQVLLGKRSVRPYRDQWALPGGVIRIDLDDDLESGCQRVAQERLGTELPNLAQVCAVGGKKRDPRAPWALSVVHRCILALDKLEAAPGKRIEKIAWVPADEAAADTTLAFDHAKLIEASAQATRADFRELRFPPGLLPEWFTLGDLQSLSEAVLGHPLDKSSFRRRIDDAGCVTPVPGQMRTGAFRPAQLFELTSTSTGGSPT